jgi:gamma-butyrobetaine dioxygenase
MGRSDEVCATLRTMVSRKGSELYGGEAVTQEQHALQAAHLAQLDGAPAHVVTAALLHDVGHLFDPDFDVALESELDHKHEDRGAHFLEQWFGPEVTEPARLHVAAKRYLCATRPGYVEALSAASAHSLELQGGPMSQEEVSAFEAQPHFHDAVRLRIYDDLAKDAQMKTPDIEHFFGVVVQCVR